MDVFRLPNSPESICQDPLSLSDSDEEEVPTWLVLKAVLPLPVASIHDLVHLLENIAITLQGKGINSEFLCTFLDSQPTLRDHFFKDVWPKLASLALELPSLFPEGYLPVLSRDPNSSSRMELNRKQIACLVVHQFLGTLSRAQWMEPDASLDFSIWYSVEQYHPKAVRAYLSTLFIYFDRIRPSDDASPDEWPVVFTLRHGVCLPLTLDVPMSPFSLHMISEASTEEAFLGLPLGACVVSANKSVGFGRTGTQEEVQVGCTPESAVVSLITPPLRDDEVLIVEGAEALTSISGYGSRAKLHGVLSDRPTASKGRERWRHRTMLFMDALELDSFDGKSCVPDLLPGNLNRELAKAFTAFSSRPASLYTEIFSGLWGCGAFGGDEQIKTIIQWCAASLASVPLHFVCAANKDMFLQQLEDFVQRVSQEKWTVDDLLKVLSSLDPYDTVAARSSFERIVCTLPPTPRNASMNASVT